jgi:hypothetical protein
VPVCLNLEGFDRPACATTKTTSPAANTSHELGGNFRRLPTAPPSHIILYLIFFLKISSRRFKLSLALVGSSKNGG